MKKLLTTPEGTFELELTANEIVQKKIDDEQEIVRLQKEKEEELAKLAKEELEKAYNRITGKKETRAEA